MGYISKLNFLIQERELSILKKNKLKAWLEEDFIKNFGVQIDIKKVSAYYITGGKIFLVSIKGQGDLDKKHCDILTKKVSILKTIKLGENCYTVINKKVNKSLLECNMIGYDISIELEYNGFGKNSINEVVEGEWGG